MLKASSGMRCPSSLVLFVALLLTVASVAQAREPSQVDLCADARQFLRDFHDAGRLGSALKRLRLVVQDALTRLDDAGLDTSKVYQEIGSLQEFSKTNTNDGRTLRYAEIVRALASFQARETKPPVAGEPSVRREVRELLEEARQMQNMMHALCSAGKRLTPDFTVFKLRPVLEEWALFSGRLDAYRAGLDTVLRPWLESHVCAIEDTPKPAATAEISSEL